MNKNHTTVSGIVFDNPEHGENNKSGEFESPYFKRKSADFEFKNAISKSRPGAPLPIDVVPGTMLTELFEEFEEEEEEVAREEEFITEPPPVEIADPNLYYFSTYGAVTVGSMGRGMPLNAHCLKTFVYEDPEVQVSEKLTIPIREKRQM